MEAGSRTILLFGLSFLDQIFGISVLKEPMMISFFKGGIDFLLYIFNVLMKFQFYLKKKIHILSQYNVDVLLPTLIPGILRYFVSLSVCSPESPRAYNMYTDWKSSHMAVYMYFMSWQSIPN